jgi:NAD(P)-dependent dehydrogenase (short-subunit alcohol dehydrogenase family)
MATSAVVTGAARGFGKEIARRLVARGHHVVITDLDADAVGVAAEELGSGRSGIVADARSATDHRRAAAAAAELPRHGVGQPRGGSAGGHGGGLSDEQMALQADAAMQLLTGRRIARSLPPSRAGLARVGGLLPRVGLPVSARLRAQGDRRRVADS